MKAVLIIYVVYESVFLKTAHSSLDVQVFDSMAQCQMIKKEAVSVIRENTKNIDSLVAKCSHIQRQISENS